MYMTLKLDDNGSCRIHSISDRNREIATNDRYVVMPWKMVTRYGKNMGPRSGLSPYGSMTLKEAVDGIINRKESEAEELERKLIKKL